MTAVTVDGELGSERGGQTDFPSRLCEADDPVEAVVIGESERFEAEAGRLFGELLRVGRSVEEAEVGVAVQLGIGHAPLPPLQPGRRLVRRSFA